MSIYLTHYVPMMAESKANCFMNIDYPFSSFNPTDKSGLIMVSVWYSKGAMDSGASPIAKYSITLRADVSEYIGIVGADTIFVEWDVMFGGQENIDLADMKQFILEKVQDYILSLGDFFGNNMTSNAVVSSSDLLFHEVASPKVSVASFDITPEKVVEA